MTHAGGGDASAGAVQAQRCYRHPNREAMVRCTRCDRPICPECMRPASVGFHCPDDVAVAARQQRPQRTSVGARLRASPPYVTIALIAANVVVYLICVSQSGRGLNMPGPQSIHDLFFRWELIPQYVKGTGGDGAQYYRLITSAFLHASLLHIASNMIALAVIGPALERLLGAWRFGVIYLLGALGGSAAVYLWGAQGGGVVGASGAIFGLFAAALVLVRRLGLDAQWLIGIIVLNFVFTFSVAGISKLGHLGGFVAGGLAALAVGGRPTAPQRIATRYQAAGLGGVAVVIVGLVLYRTATF